MGNNEAKPVVQENKQLYVNELFTTLNPDVIVDIRERYKIVDVDWFDRIQVNSTIFADEYFNSKPNKKKVLNDMVEHFLTDKDKHIYEKKTNYLCNRKEQLCICNTHANDFRKIYDGINYRDETYVAWVKKSNEAF